MVGLIGHHLSASKLSVIHQFLLLPLFLVAVAGSVHCLGEMKVLSLQKSQREERSYPYFASTLRRRREKGAAILVMKHHPHFSGPIANQDDYLQKLLISDEARVSTLQARFSKEFHKDSSEAQVPLTSGVQLQTLNYVVTVGVGSKKMTVIVDTGSDLTWVQCKPCFYCYNQQDPIFDPSSSPSYQAVSCNSTTCYSLQTATGSAGICGADKSSCSYSLSYGDGSYTHGILGREKIDLGGTTVENFVFGCGRSNRGLFGGTSGLMGLGRTELSLVSQTAAQFGGIFSYCLPAKVINSSGSLVLGDDLTLYKNSTPISYTRMIPDPQLAPFYFLNLTGLRVGGVALQAAGFSNGKILIDSGTVITRLEPSIYKALKAEILKQLSGYPPASSFSILDTCFNLSGYEEVKVPTVRLGFEGGAEMNVNVAGIFYFVKKDASQVCLAMSSLQYEDQVGIIGNYQQKYQRVVYDTKSSRIGFAEEICS